MLKKLNLYHIFIFIFSFIIFKIYLYDLPKIKCDYQNQINNIIMLDSIQSERIIELIDVYKDMTINKSKINKPKYYDKKRRTV